MYEVIPLLRKKCLDTEFFRSAFLVLGVNTEIYKHLPVILRIQSDLKKILNTKKTPYSNTLFAVKVFFMSYWITVSIITATSI